MHTFGLIMLYVAIAVLPLLISVAIRSRGASLDVDTQSRVYRSSSWMYVPIIILSGLGLVLIAKSFSFSDVDWFFLLLGGLFWGLSMAGIRKFRNSYVVIADDKLICQYGNERRVTDFKAVRSVYTVGWQIVVDTGEKWKIGIPMIFRGSSEIFGILKACEGRNRKNKAQEGEHKE